MTYSALGFYDRKEGHPERYPSCATAAEKAAASKACQPVQIAGLGALGRALGAALSGTRFDGANPCWVEALPTCPTCLTSEQMTQYMRVVRGETTGAEAMKIAHLANLYSCPKVPVPAMPDCIVPEARPVIDYCKKYPAFDGPNKTLNAGCWQSKRWTYGGIGGGYWAVISKRGDCPKCLTKAELSALSDCIRNGQFGKSGSGIPAICSSPKRDWKLCPDVQVPDVPSCLDANQDRLVQYCKTAGGVDPQQDAACYVFKRSPDYWGSMSTRKRCPPICTKEQTCWDGSKICLSMQAPGEAAFDPGQSCPPKPAPVAPPASVVSPSPERKGLSTGSILLAAAVVGGGAFWLARRRKKAR